MHKSISINKILAPNYIKDESVPYTKEKLICIEGYVILQKMGGSESCNCHAKNKDGWDVHLEVAKTPNAKGIDAMICEVTPKYPNRDKVDWKGMVGKKVRITGYLFSDIEHYHNAVNTNPKGTNLWRRTEIECHPVVNIEVIE